MQNEFIDRLIVNALKGEGIARTDALQLETLTRDELEYLFEGTDKIRNRFKGRDVKICSIVNAKSGRCVEDCSFCAQSSQFETDSPEYELMTVDEIVAAAKEAEAFGSNEFSIVTSGTAMDDRQELDKIIEAVKRTIRISQESPPIFGHVSSPQFFQPLCNLQRICPIFQPTVLIPNSPTVYSAGVKLPLLGI